MLFLHIHFQAGVILLRKKMNSPTAGKFTANSSHPNS